MSNRKKKRDEENRKQDSSKSGNYRYRVRLDQWGKPQISTLVMLI